MSKLLPKVEELQLQLEEILRGHQTKLQNFADSVSDQYRITDTNTYKVMLDLSDLALLQKSQTSEVLASVKKTPLIRSVA